MAQKIYCVNSKCAKPIEYAYSKPNFCPYCGNSFSTAPIANNPPQAKQTASSIVSKSGDSSSALTQTQINNQAKLAQVQRKMEARRILAEHDISSSDDDDDDYEESSAFIDFSNFQMKASVRVPKQEKFNLGDLSKMEKE